MLFVKRHIVRIYIYKSESVIFLNFRYSKRKINFSMKSKRKFDILRVKHKYEIVKSKLIIMFL
jgi:hypothetical protein